MSPIRRTVTLRRARIGAGRVVSHLPHIDRPQGLASLALLLVEIASVVIGYPSAHSEVPPVVDRKASNGYKNAMPARSRAPSTAIEAV